MADPCLASEPVQRFFDAIENGDTATLRALAADGLDSMATVTSLGVDEWRLDRLSTTSDSYCYSKLRPALAGG